MLTVNNLTGFGVFSGGTPATVSFTDNVATDAVQTTYTFTTRAIGTAAANRVVVISCSMEQSGPSGLPTVASVTIGGISATQVATVTASDGTEVLEMWEAAVPTGTTATIVVNLNNDSEFCAMGVWAVYGAGTTKYNSATSNSTGSPISASINSPAGGVIIAASAIGGGGTWTWTNVTENFDATHRSGNRNYSGASLAYAAAQTGLSVSATPSGGGSSAARLIVASWS
jgi:hypothetical protein